MICLNKFNGAFDHTIEVATRCLTEFSGELVGAELGIAWGGGPEELGKLWADRGIVHGYDTFEGHPKQLAADPLTHEATCMDPQYKTFGMAGIDYFSQVEELKKQGITNVQLHKGLINSESMNGIDKLHYVLLDMDLVHSMTFGYSLVEPLIVQGGYLCLHDVVPQNHIEGLWELYRDIMKTGKWELVGEWHKEYLVILKRK
jgi:hypothetical protein